MTNGLILVTSNHHYLLQEYFGSNIDQIHICPLDCIKFFYNRFELLFLAEFEEPEDL